MNDQLRAEIEQNANIVYHETRNLVGGMEPSLAAVTIAYDMLYREVTEALIMADWTPLQVQSYADLVGRIVNARIQEAFDTAVRECEALVKPEVAADTTIIFPGASSSAIN